MKWFKHMTDMSDDVRIKRLRRRYGVEGYGLYNYIIERIVRRLEKDSPLPELEEEAQDIAGELNMDTVRVEEIIRYVVDQGLFAVDTVTGRLVAHKVYKFLEESTTRSKELKQMIKNYKASISYDENLQMSRTVSDSLGQSETVSDCPGLSGQDKKRTEEIRTEKNKNSSQSHDSEAEAEDDDEVPFDDAPAKSGEKPKELSAMRDNLANEYQSAFTAEVPAEAWKSVAQERKHLNDLAKRTRKLAEVTGIDEQNLAAKLRSTYAEMRQTSRAEYWRNAPFVPSALTARWDAVVEQLRRDYDDGLPDDFEEVGF